MTPRELIIAARALREHYFFQLLSEDWIQISKRNVEEIGNRLPNTVEELKQQIEQRNLQTILNFSITKQKEILSAIEFLKQNLVLESIPDFAFQLTFLLSPSWKLDRKSIV